MNAAAPRLLVTRPEPGASKTAMHLRQLAFAVDILPLTRIVAVEADPEAVAMARTADIVAVTSANALRHAPAGLLQSLRSRPVYAVGQATADAARNAGFTTVHVSGGDAALLATDMLDPRQLGHRQTGSGHEDGAHIAFLCGYRRVSTLEEILKQAGRTVTVLPVYDTEIVSYLTDKETACVPAQYGGILLHAQSAAQALGQLPAPNLAALVSDITTFFAISERVAEALPSKWQVKTVVADTPDDAAMVRAVLSRYGSG